MKIAVIGIGKSGQRHLKIWSKLEAIEVVGIVGRNQEKLQVFGEQYGVKTYTSVEDLLRAEEVDAFDICTPTDTHFAFVNQIAEANKHIICTKPLGVTSAEAEEMIAICEQNNVQLLVGHTLRFFPEYADAKAQVENGAIGRPGVIRMSRGVPYPSTDRAWYADEKRSGGLFLDLGVHEFEWIQSTFGEVHRVMAKHVKHTEANGRTMEYGLVTMRMVDGTVVHVELSWAETKFRASFELTGADGMITYNHDETNPVILDVYDDGSSVDLPKSMLRRDPFVRQLEHFLACLAGKAEPIVLATDALAAIQIAEAARKSAAQGQPVVLNEGGTKEMKIGIISFAHMHALSYAAALRDRKDVELSYIWDEDEVRGKEMAARYNCQYIASLDDFLQTDIEAVVICSENINHKEHVIKAAKAQKHILCEKPIATEVKDAEAMIKACEEANVILQIAYPVRFAPVIENVKAMIQQGAIGEVLAINATNHGLMPGGWFIDKELSGGGSATDHIVHIMDVIRWIFEDEVKTVYAELDTRFYDIDVEDCGMVSLELESGMIVSIDPSWSRPKTYPTWGNVVMHFVGTKGNLSVDAFKQHSLYYNDVAEKIEELPWSEDMDASLIADFIDCVKSNGIPSITGMDGLRTLEVVKAAYQSSESNKTITLERV